MADRGDAALRRARALIGTRFRAQGRDARLGLDCIGVVLDSYGIDPRAVRSDYRLSSRIDDGELRRALEPWFRPVGRRQSRPGDLILAAPAKGQRHLAMISGEGVIHADARLRKVVELPGPPPWPILAIFRRRSRTRRLAKG